ncbi:MAG: hypothetical protein WCF16_02440 [Alphaproteobacteria bacterium]
MTSFAAAFGAMVWIVIAHVGERNEAWDSPLYASVGLPLMLVAAAFMGYFAPRHPWRYAIAMTGAQFITMLVTTGVGALLPLGAAIFAVLTLPLGLSAWLGGVARRAFGQRGED